MAEKFSGPEEIYKELVDDFEGSWLMGLVAFATIEQQKIEWMRHQKSNNDSPPTADEIKSWYEQLPPDSVLLRAQGDAANALKTYTEEVIEFVLEEKQKEIEEGIIVSELKGLREFWPQFRRNVIAGVAGALLCSRYFGYLWGSLATMTRRRLK